MTINRLRGLRATQLRQWISAMGDLDTARLQSELTAMEVRIQFNLPEAPDEAKTLRARCRLGWLT